MKKVNISKFIALLLVFACVAIMPLTAVAEDRLGSVSIVFYHEDNTPIENAAFSIYKVAEKSGSEYVLVDEFTKYSISLKDLNDTDALSSLTYTLSAYIARDSIAPYAEGQTSSSGGLYFGGLEKGLYIGIGEPTKNGDTTYIPQPFIFSIPGDITNGDESLYDVVVEPKYDLYRENDTVELRALKIWDDGNNLDKSRPESITVQLLKNGEIYEEVVLNDANNWRYEWKNLDAECQWLLIEKEVAPGYVVAVNRQGITFTVTNTHEPVEPPDETTTTDKPETPNDPRLPQTGQLWWPVPVLLVAGVAVCLMGIAKRRSDNENA